MAFVDCSKIVLLKQMIVGTVVKKKNYCKESTYPEPVKKGVDLSAFLCETTACKNSECLNKANLSSLWAKGIRGVATGGAWGAAPPWPQRLSAIF